MSAEPTSSKWLETAAASLMALATLGTAWSSYQSAAWTRKSGGLVNKSNAFERRAAVWILQGNQALMIHTAMFMQIMTAREAGNEHLAQFYADRLPPEAKKAYTAWLAQRPFDDAAAEPHPFVPSLYEPRFSKEAAEAQAEAGELVQEAGRAGATSGEYLSNTVLCASVLFFAGIAAKLKSKMVQRGMFAFGLAAFLYVAVRTLASLPTA